VKRRFRLTRSTDFKRVRRSGKSYAHPLVVLIKEPSQTSETRIGITAGRSVGNAVVRNRAKRQLRAIVSGLLPQLKPGWNLVLVCREPIRTAEFSAIQAAVELLLGRAGLLNDPKVA
jgi:ribonuclease P protein component